MEEVSPTSQVCACGEYFNVDETGELCLNPGTMGLRKTIVHKTPGTYQFRKADYPWLARIRVRVQGAAAGRPVPQQRPSNWSRGTGRPAAGTASP